MAGATSVEQHYGGLDISARIPDALAHSGRDPARLTREDLTPFDEFHGGGIDSTRDLARYAAIAPGHRVLDVGAGIGGPARTLAAEYGCEVCGVDLTPAFVAAATMLTARVGLAERCTFRHGDATALPFPDACFDFVLSQNMLMNVADKAVFFA